MTKLKYVEMRLRIMRYKIITVQVPLEALEKQGIWTDEISNVKEM